MVPSLLLRRKYTNGLFTLNSITGSQVSFGISANTNVFGRMPTEKVKPKFPNLDSKKT